MIIYLCLRPFPSFLAYSLARVLVRCAHFVPLHDDLVSEPVGYTISVVLVCSSTLCFYVS